jgi:hypothetical protein
MREQAEYRCDQHPDPFDCPDNLVYYNATFNEYGLIIHDGGGSKLNIDYCPWCGTALPASRRDEWFDRIEALGLDPSEDDLPAEYHSDAWYRRPVT